MRPIPLLLPLAAVLASLSAAVHAAPKPNLWPRWTAHVAQSNVQVNHSAWDKFLRKYVVTQHPSRINRLRYASVTSEDRRSLADYVASLERIRVSYLALAEQKAYWINLYNALTVKVVLDHYPVTSIRDIKSGWFSSGPWDLKLAAVEGEEITLDEIEHRILRPIFRDPRVHYALNCASLGCPNLQPEAFTPQNMELLLEKGASEYVNHPRGVRVDGDKLTASSIYDWFQADFGGSEEGVLRHIRLYALGPLAELLRAFHGDFSYAYDWKLNE